MSSNNIKDVYPLSPMQEGILFHSLYAPDSGLYINQMVLTLKGLDAAHFERAWQQLVNRHTSLRTAFVWKNVEKPLQVVGERVFIALTHKDWRDPDSEEQERCLESYLLADRQRGFELSKAPLMRIMLARVEEDVHKFIWSHHHLLLDGWSLPLLLKELFLLYEAFAGGGEADLTPAQPYSDYIRWLQPQDMKAAESFWRRQLAGFSAPTPLGIDNSAGGFSHEDSFAELESHLSSSLTASLQSFARRHQLTLNTVLQGAWSMLLSSYSGSKDVVFGATVSGRPAGLKGSDSMVGLFINTLPVRVHLPQNGTLISWLKQHQEQQFEAQQYEYTPLVQVQGWSDVPRGTSLFDTIFIFENYPMGGVAECLNKSVEIRDIRVHERNNYPLAVVAAMGEQLSLRIIFDSSRFACTAIESLLRQFRNLLENLIASEPLTLADWSLLTETERQYLLTEWNEAGAYYPKSSSIQQLFEGQAEQKPEAVAVSCAREELSYAELNERANRLAHYLRAAGVQPGTLLAICMEHSTEAIVAMLGTLKAGAAYVPLEPSHPRERLEFIVQDAAAPFVLTQQRLADRFSFNRAKVICLDEDWEMIERGSKENPESITGGDDLAYVIYTSGSTGRPKGVEIRHSALVNYVWWAKEQYLRGDSLCFPLYSSLAFDLTVTSIYLPLVTGNRIIIYPSQSADTPLWDVLKDNQAGVLKLTPSHLSLIKDRDNTGSRVKRLIVGGEAFDAELARHTLKSFGGNIEIFNEYGPTEATVGCMIHQFNPAKDNRLFVPIGRPAANTQIYLLDEHLKPVAENVVGQLYISGEGLAQGYLKKPELTAERFLDNPFRPGQKMYQSGDLARRLHDGSLEYLGRTDEQVKFHGYRVELNEIRSTLNNHPQVRDSVVLLRKDRNNNAVMVAYYVSQQEIKSNELREFLSGSIIKETMPNLFIHIEQLPLTSNGKINLEALPTPSEAKERSEVISEAPRTPVEEALAAIWAQVLDVEKVGINDNFFELGGHSLLASQIMSRVRTGFEVELPLRTLFDAPTVAAFALEITLAQVEQEDGEEMAQILEELKGLAEDNARSSIV